VIFERVQAKDDTQIGQLEVEVVQDELVHCRGFSTLAACVAVAMLIDPALRIALPWHWRHVPACIDGAFEAENAWLTAIDQAHLR
jgi:hypothetical protein